MEDELTEDTGQALELLYESSFGKATRVAARIVGHAQAEDIASETMLRAAQRLGEGRSLAEVEQLIPLIAFGIAANEYRRGDIPSGLGREDDELGHLLSARARTFEEADFTALFDYGVRALEDDDRDAFILTELRGLTTREAGDVLDTSHTTVRRRAEAARLAVRKEIA
jgi:DNA-directed RNA polymerase specialized sigma24 family protein